MQLDSLLDPNHNPGESLEPEDYQGMLKTSAWQRDSNRYNRLDGWGFLKPDSLFNMLSTGYRISHWSNTDNLSFGPWGDTLTIQLITNVREDDTLCLSSSYFAHRREVSSVIHLPSSFWLVDSLHNQLYVWGRSGQDPIKGGWSAANPNCEIPYTRVTSGTGGMFYHDSVETDTIDGIFHSHSLDVTAKTYQYQIYIDSSKTWIIRPTDDNLELFISVFGREKSYTDVVTINNQGNIYGEIYPNPTNNYLYVNFGNSNLINHEIAIFDIFGRLIIKKDYYSGMNDPKIDIGNLSSGCYYCRISSTEGSTVKSIQIIK